MPQTINEIKIFLQSIKPDSIIVNDQTIIQFVNEVDGSVHYEIYKEKTSVDFALVEGQSEYNLPDGVVFDYIDQIYVNDESLQKIDESYKNTTGFLKGSTSSKVRIYPVPNDSDETGETNLTIVYLKPYVKHTSLFDTVFVDSPHDKMYYEYLSAKIGLFKEDTETFNNMITLYNTSKAEYTAWYNERHTNRKA